MGEAGQGGSATRLREQKDLARCTGRSEVRSPCVSRVQQVVVMTRGHFVPRLTCEFESYLDAGM